MKHTALPWKFKPLSCDDNRGMGYMFGGDGREISHCGVAERGKDENIANAEFIVRACNSHGDLVASLILVKALIKAGETVQNLETIIDVAISKAGAA